MNTWLTLRIFTAVFLASFGTGLIFVRSEDLRILVGAVLTAIGVTFLIRMEVVLRRS